jgi:hypothetical protein
MKDLLSAATFGLLPVPSSPACDLNHRPMQTKALGREAFAPCHRDVAKTKRTPSKRSKQQTGVTHATVQPTAHSGLLQGVAVMVILALLLIGGAVVSVRAASCTTKANVVQLKY